MFLGTWRQDLIHETSWRCFYCLAHIVAWVDLSTSSLNGLLRASFHWTQDSLCPKNSSSSSVLNILFPSIYLSPSLPKSITTLESLKNELGKFWHFTCRSVPSSLSRGISFSFSPIHSSNFFIHTCHTVTTSIPKLSPDSNSCYIMIKWRGILLTMFLQWRDYFSPLLLTFF